VRVPFYAASVDEVGGSMRAMREQHEKQKRPAGNEALSMIMRRRGSALRSAANAGKER
jgi:hypothetical protein